MAQLAVTAEGLGKRYFLGEDYRAARSRSGVGSESLVQAMARGLRRRGRSSRAEIWALKDVGFEVRQGEIVGVIGHNGSGKSTLLKLLSRITSPTEGRAAIRGRVGALLEVGTGFHPELTGRENVFLNGALLGMSRRDIVFRFADIVEFAGVEGFLDTPVKRYSTGMKLRLAFAIAAHLEPEVLIIDEVLAVGDAEFQARCLGRMAEARRDGRTVLFVSHDLSAVHALCERGIWLSGGRLMHDGTADEVIRRYRQDAHGNTEGGSRVELPALRTPAYPHQVWLSRPDGEEIDAVRRDEPFTVNCVLVVREPVPHLTVVVYLTTDRGLRVIEEELLESGRIDPSWARRPGVYRVSMAVPPILASRPYGVGLWVGTGYEEFFDREVLSTTILPNPSERADGERDRAARPDVHWEVALDDTVPVPRGGSKNGTVPPGPR